LLLIVIGIYGFGDMARQNPKIDTFIERIEIRYCLLNDWLIDIDIKNGLTATREIFSWLAVIFSQAR